MVIYQKKVSVNGTPIDEPYAQYLDPPSADGQPAGDARLDDYASIAVPAGQYFMMGDNRDNSEDSRYWGFMPESYVKGQALFIYFSFGENGSLSGLFSNVQWGRLFNRVR